MRQWRDCDDGGVDLRRWRGRDGGRGATVEVLICRRWCYGGGGTTVEVLICRRWCEGGGVVLQEVVRRWRVERVVIFVNIEG